MNDPNYGANVSGEEQADDETDVGYDDDETADDGTDADDDNGGANSSASSEDDHSVPWWAWGLAIVGLLAGAAECLMWFFFPFVLFGAALKSLFRE